MTRRDIRSKQERKKAIYERDGGQCQIRISKQCIPSLSLEEATLDHIIPYSHCGPSTDDNLQIACRPCNEEKANHYACPCGLPPTAPGCRKGIDRAWERLANDLEWQQLYREWKDGLVPMLKPHWKLPLDDLEIFFKEQKKQGIRP